MGLPLRSLGLRRAVLGASLAFAAVLFYSAGRLWLADHWVYSSRLDLIERGVALEPENSAAWDRLGRFHTITLDPSRSVAAFQKAVENDPLSAHYWMDLAGAYESAGKTGKAREAFEQAGRVYPVSAEVAWNYGNFLIRQQHETEGFAEIAHAVRTDPTILPLAISRCWRSTGNANQMLDHIIPASVAAYMQTLDFFASIARADEGLIVWGRLLKLGKPFPLSQSFPFLEELIREDNAEESRRVWRQALAAAGLPHDEAVDQSLIWNGNFARDATNGGLDWRWEPRTGMNIDYDSAPPGPPGRSLRLDFGGGTNPDLAQPAQFVPVEPSRQYHFRAFLRTEGITTESKIGFLILDPHHSAALYIQTTGLTSSHPWTPIEADVATGPKTHFLWIALRRMPSRLFENKLSGTVWTADVSLVQKGEEPTVR